jgi:hypothetical protein
MLVKERRYFTMAIYIPIYEKIKRIDDKSWYDLGVMALDDDMGSSYHYCFEPEGIFYTEGLTEFIATSKDLTEVSRHCTYLKNLTRITFGNLLFLQKTNILPTPDFLKLCKTLDKYYDEFMEAFEKADSTTDMAEIKASVEKIKETAEKVQGINIISNLMREIYDKCCSFNETYGEFRPDSAKIKAYFTMNLEPLLNHKRKGLINKVNDYFMKKQIHKINDSMPAEAYNGLYKMLIQDAVNTLMKFEDTDDLIIIKKDELKEYLKTNGFEDKHLSRIYNIIKIPTIMAYNSKYQLSDRESRHEYMLKGFNTGKDKLPDVILLNDKRMLMESRFEHSISLVCRKLPEEQKKIGSDFINMIVNAYKSLSELTQQASKGNISVQSYEIETDGIMDRIPFDYDKDTGKFKYQRYIPIIKRDYKEFLKEQEKQMNKNDMELELD